MTWISFYCTSLLLTVYLQCDLIKGEASERSTGWNLVFCLISGVVCGGSSPGLRRCHSSICERQKNPGAEAASRSGSHYNPSKHSWIFQIVKVVSSAQRMGLWPYGSSSPGKHPCRVSFLPCTRCFLGWQWFIVVFIWDKAHHAHLFRLLHNYSRFQLFLQKQEAKFPQLWLYFFLSS